MLRHVNVLRSARPQPESRDVLAQYPIYWKFNHSFLEKKRESVDIWYLYLIEWSSEPDAIMKGSFGFHETQLTVERWPAMPHTTYSSVRRQMRIVSSARKERFLVSTFSSLKIICVLLFSLSVKHTPLLMWIMRGNMSVETFPEWKAGLRFVHSGCESRSKNRKLHNVFWSHRWSTHWPLEQSSSSLLLTTSPFSSCSSAENEPATMYSLLMPPNAALSTQPDYDFNYAIKY